MSTDNPRKPLDRDLIVEVAGQLIDQDGLGPFSMRKLAGALGVEPMSLYHWFPSKDHVMDALLDRFVGHVQPPDQGTWEERVAAVARAFRAAALINPGAFPFFAIHRFNTEICLGRLEAILSALAMVHSEPARRAMAFRLLVHWLVGFSLDETSGFSKGPSAQDPPPDDVVAARFPRVAELGPFNKPAHFDALFEAGLAAVVAGIRALAAPSGRPDSAAQGSPR